MFWIIIALAALVAFAMPWTFKYLVMMPFLGLVLGGFVWGTVGLMGAPVFSVSAAVAIVLACTFVIGLLIHHFDP